MMARRSSDPRLPPCWLEPDRHREICVHIPTACVVWRWPVQRCPLKCLSSGRADKIMQAALTEIDVREVYRWTCALRWRVRQSNPTI